VRTYRQYCPIARASEVVAERWTPLVVRNLLWGATTFSDIAHGVPTMSRSMLIKRLSELQRAGVVDVRPKERGQGSLYSLTPAGRDLAGVIDGLARWGERWLEVTSEHSDPGFALWAWARFQLARDRLPAARVVVRFTFPEEPPSNRRYWLLVEGGTAELCYSDPGGEPDAEVVARSAPFARWHRGDLAWGEALRTGAIAVTGRRPVVRALPSWNTHTPDLAPDAGGADAAGATDLEVSR
jgi:DNA-binding HxlR family transcriptional regulator